MTGVMNQWLDEQSSYIYPDGVVNDATQVVYVYYVASLEGAPLYLKWNNQIPYICGDITTDLWLTFGSYKVLIKADVDPSTGGSQIYFRDAATRPFGLYSTTASGKNAFIPSSDPDFKLPIVYHASPNTQGVELRYDNVTHNRLEAINTGGANVYIGLGTGIELAYYSLPAGKGQIQRQGTIGDIKMYAGGSWSSGALGGSQGRSMCWPRWLSGSGLGARYCSDPA
jgi:hypothetical protein